MTIHTPLCGRFGVEHPVMLAPMAGVSGGALAAAVSTAGGLGLVGGGYGDEALLRSELDAAGNARIGVGFITWVLARNPSLLDVALEREPVAIMLSFGDIKPFAEKIRRTSTKLIAQVQTVRDARCAVDAGADGIVAQGTEAGGHGGARATLPLVPAVVDIAGEIPVIAAGGISDGRGLAAALALGASGALCGTAFYAAEESLAHRHAKSAAVSASGDDTERGSAYDILRGFDWPLAWNLRTLTNAFTKRWRGDTEGLLLHLDAERARFHDAVTEGNIDIAPVIVGEGVDQVKHVRPAADILQTMIRDAQDCVRVLAAMTGET